MRPGLSDLHRDPERCVRVLHVPSMTHNAMESMRACPGSRHPRHGREGFVQLPHLPALPPNAMGRTGCGSPTVARLANSRQSGTLQSHVGPKEKHNATGFLRVATAVGLVRFEARGALV